MDDSRRAGMEEETSPNCLSVGAPANALSPSPDGTRVVVGGRDVMKILSVNLSDNADHVFEESDNIRVGKLNLNYSTLDVRWHPTLSNLIVSAATNGAVVLWNTEKKTKNKLDRVFDDHTRTVHRVCWHPVMTDVFLSCSQDGTVKLWDTRVMGCRSTYTCRNGSIRDVQFSPLFPDHFAAGFENGDVQIWDVRKPVNNVISIGGGGDDDGIGPNYGSLVHKITAHQGNVFTVAWHPSDHNRLASGGRDRAIKSWNLLQPGRPEHEILTLSSVGRIFWSLHDTNQIVSAASLMDFKIHIYDVRLPYVPIASFHGHDDVVTGICPEYRLPGISPGVLSCSKDGTVRRHHFSSATSPLKQIRTIGMSWSVQNNLAYVYETIDRDTWEKTGLKTMKLRVTDAKIKTNFSNSDVKVKIPSFMSSTTGIVMNEGSSLGFLRSPNPSIVNAVCHILALPEAAGVDTTVVTYLAENYRLRGMLFNELCEHNAVCCLNVGRLKTAQSWRLLSVLYDMQQFAVISNSTSNIQESSNSAANVDSHRSNDTTDLQNRSTDNDSSNLSITKLDSFFVNPMLSSAHNGNILENTDVDNSSKSEEIIMNRELWSGFEGKYSPPSESKITEGNPITNDPTSLSTTDGIDYSSFLMYDSLIDGSVDPFFDSTLFEKSGQETESNVEATQGDTRARLKIKVDEDVVVNSKSDVAFPNEFLGDGIFIPHSSALRANHSSLQQQPSIESCLTMGVQLLSLVQKVSYPLPCANINMDVTDSQIVLNEEPAINNVQVESKNVEDTAIPLKSEFQNSKSGPSVVASEPLSVSFPEDFSCNDLTLSLLNFYVENGDIQTSACMYFVLDWRLKCNLQFVAWVIGYVELLQRVNQFSSATEVMSMAVEKKLYSFKQQSVDFHLGSGCCRKPVKASGIRCTEGCGKTVGQCSVCELPVKGLFIWCQGCGHGGHLQHMQEWFRTKDTCPTGCLHRCTLVMQSNKQKLI